MAVCYWEIDISWITETQELWKMMAKFGHTDGVYGKSEASVFGIKWSKMEGMINLNAQKSWTWNVAHMYQVCSLSGIDNVELLWA